jgi:predicted nuclease of restriction endonuclease-like RecB superfamily
VLTKDLLRVSRRGGGYQPQFVDASRESLAARVIGCYQGHVGQSRGELQEALTDIERESDDFKLVRGFAKLLDREATWEVRAPVAPRRAREAGFRASEAVGVVTESEREQALRRAAEHLDATPDAVQTALFDATEVHVRSDDPKRVISAVKRLRLLYEVRRVPDEKRRAVGDTDREIVVTGPDALFRSTRRYGTRFARLLRTAAGTAEWRLTATIDDRGTERELVLTDADISVPGVEPVTEVTYDSGVEESFARRFEALDLPWELVREPDALAAGEHVVVPDFAFDWHHGEFRVYFEIMGFWTPEYVEKKLSRLADVDAVEMLVAVDESLGVGEEIEARDHRAITYAGEVRLRDVRGALREYEERLVADAAAALPDELRPDAAVVALADLAAEHGVSEAALDDVTFPEHERVGRTLVRPAVLDALDGKLAAGMSLDDAEALLTEYGIEETSAALSTLGYRVEWAGLGGGTVREK